RHLVLAQKFRVAPFEFGSTLDSCIQRCQLAVDGLDLVYHRFYFEVRFLNLGFRGIHCRLGFQPRLLCRSAGLGGLGALGLEFEFQEPQRGLDPPDLWMSRYIRLSRRSQRPFRFSHSLFEYLNLELSTLGLVQSRAAHRILELRFRRQLP